MSDHIGFIGLGRMGGPMSGRLIAAGHRLTVFDTRADAVQALVARGAQPASSVAEVAAAVDTVLLSLPTPDIVEAVAAQIAAGGRAKTVVDLSTTGPRVARRVAEALKARGITAIDSPVSGGIAGAVNGTLAVMVAGPRGHFDALEPVLKNFGKVFFIGEEPGMGQMMKLCNNFLSATAMAATAEAVVLGAKAGLDPKVMVDVINAGSGMNTASRDKFPKSVLPRTFDFGFATGLLWKDVRLCVDEAEAQGVPMMVGGAVKQVWSLANRKLGPDSDFTAVVKLAEDWAGFELPKERLTSMANLPTYEVLAIKYGHHHRMKADNFIGGDPHDEPMPIDYFLWVIRGNGRVFVVDTGFDATEGGRRGRTLDRTVDQALALVGVDHAAVEDVIISHLHYDHAGNHALFPKAKFHLQEKEMQYATGPCMCMPVLRWPFAAADVMKMVERLFQDRVVFHDGDSDVAPGISVHRVGGHTMGLQMVRVHTARGWVVLAADAAHYYANMEEGRPFPIVYNVFDMLRGHRRAYELASSEQHVVPGHDPLVLARFPAASQALEGIACRLDLAPLRW